MKRELKKEASRPVNGHIAEVLVRRVRRLVDIESASESRLWRGSAPQSKRPALKPRRTA